MFPVSEIKVKIVAPVYIKRNSCHKTIQNSYYSPKDSMPGQPLLVMNYKTKLKAGKDAQGLWQ